MPQTQVEECTDDQGRDQEGEDIPEGHLDIGSSVKLSPDLPGHIQPLSRYGEASVQNPYRSYFEGERHGHQ